MFRAPLVALVRLTGNPGRAELLERISRALSDGPLTNRLDLVDGHPHLIPSTVDPDQHLQSVPAGSAGDVLADLSGAVAAPFPADRPPWRILLHDAGSSGTSLALVLDHAVADGRAALAMAGRLFDGWLPRVVDATSPEARAPRVDSRRSGLVAGIGLARSVVRLTRVHDRPLSPLLTSRGGTQTWHTLDVSPAVLRQGARHNGVTVNDVFVGGVLAGIGAYHREQGADVTRLRVNIPISLRAREGRAGNSLAVARATLPVPADGAVADLRRIHATLLAWRSEPALSRSDRLAEASRLLPVGLMATVARSSDATISNLGPVPGAASIAGHRVEQVYPLPATTGVAVSVALLTYGDVGCVGMAIDAAAVSDPAVLVAHIRSALTAPVPG